MKQKKQYREGRLIILNGMLILFLLTAAFSVSAVINDPPVADANGPYVDYEGNIVIFDGSGSYDPDGDSLLYRWDLDNDGVYDTSWSTDPTTSYTWMDDYTGTVLLQVSDGEDCDTDSSCVTIRNVAPTAELTNDGPVDEGSMVTVSFTSVYDPGADTFTYSYDWDNDGIYDIIDSVSPTASYTWCDNGCYMVKGKIMDDDGGSNEYYTTVQVLNVAPMVTVGSDMIIYPGDTMISSGSFFDPGCDSWIATVDYGDGTGVQPLTLNGFNFDLSHQYDIIGTYTVTVTVTDDDGGCGIDELIVEVECLPVVYVDDNAHPSWYNYSHVHTIQTGIDRVCPGGIVYVYNGSYAEEVIIYKEDITVTAVFIPPLHTTANTCAYIHGSFQVEADCITIEKFVFSATISGAIQIKEGVNADCVSIHHNKFLLECIDDAIGVLNDGTGLADARYNYWGAYDGPSGLLTDPISGRIANGYGVLVGDKVIFDTWAGIDATADASSNSVNVGDIVIFNSAESFAYHLDGSSNNYEVRWDFDDGTYSFDPNPSHVFTSEGTYQVSLRIKSTDIQLVSGLMYDWDYLTIHVYNPGSPLTAHANIPNFEGYETRIDEPLQLFGSASGGLAPYTYSWELETGKTLTEQNPLLSFDNPGSYQITLSVVDSRGDQASDTTEINVYGEDDFIIIIDELPDCSVYSRIDFSMIIQGGTSPYTYLWDFGDGSTSTDQHPSHVYTIPGEYTITLTVTDDKGDIDTDTALINVEKEDTPAEIVEISGGVFLKVRIAAGDTPVEWSIDVDGNVMIGGSATGSIAQQTEQTVTLPLTFGFGPVNIKIQTNTEEKIVSGYLFGPLFIILN